jgi:hypothetical protein
LLDGIGTLPDDPRPSLSRPFNVSTRLAWTCAVHGCSKISDFTLCPACQSAQYCGREHVYADRPKHRSVCSRIKKAQATFAKEDKALRKLRGDSIFDIEWTSFWAWDRSEYISARQALVEALFKMNTAQAVSMALEHLLDMLRLNPGDRKGARDVIPALFIRLGRDQEAYDFGHWWATTGHAPDYDWTRTDARYTNTRDADIFEEVDAFTGDGFHLSHVVAITLLKIRLIIDLQSLQRARAFAGPHVPRELFDVIQQHSTLSNITNNSKYTDREDLTPQIRGLRAQILILFEAVHKANMFFWPALVEPANHLRARATAYGEGDKRQMQLALQQNYNAWAETPGAIDVIGERLEGVTRVKKYFHGMVVDVVVIEPPN